MEERGTLEALRSFASIARELAANPDRAATSSRIAQLAVKVVGCDAAIVSCLVHGRPVVRASTDDQLAGVIHSVAVNTGHSMSRQACRERVTVLCNDLEHDQPWAQVAGRVVAETPVRAALALPLQLESQSLGALTLYSNTAGYFTPALCELVDVYADHAAIALSAVTEHERAEHLHVALATNREIGAAIGIVMARVGVDMGTAFDLLRTVSQHTNRKLSDVAADVVRTGDVAVLTAATFTSRLTRLPSQLSAPLAHVGMPPGL